MGIGPFGSSHCDHREPNSVIRHLHEHNVKLPNPNPRNFKIVDEYEYGSCVVVKINYPDCTNYEGNKILVYHGISLENLKKLPKLDPHFCEDCISPIARFRPNMWNIAVNFAEKYSDNVLDI